MNIIRKGNQPKLLLLSGMHGDEYGVIEHIASYISRHIDLFPDFLYIPRVSPSAVLKKQRLNEFGHDINRSFTSPISDAEVRTCVNIVHKHTFLVCLDFHEDPDLINEFYMYDTDKFPPDVLGHFRSEIQKTGTKLFNGLDDPTDDTLGNMVVDGYIPIHIDISEPDSGFSSGWMLRHRVAKRYITFEIPGKASPTHKQKLVDCIFTFFLNPDNMIQ